MVKFSQLNLYLNLRVTLENNHHFDQHANINTNHLMKQLKIILSKIHSKQAVKILRKKKFTSLVRDALDTVFPGCENIKIIDIEENCIKINKKWILR